MITERHEVAADVTNAQYDAGIPLPFLNIASPRWRPFKVGGTKVVLKKYQVQAQYPVENPPKVNRTEPYRAVPCSGKAPLVEKSGAVRQALVHVLLSESL